MHPLHYRKLRSVCGACCEEKEGLECNAHGIVGAEGFVTVRAFARAGDGALFNALFAEDMTAGFDDCIFEVDAADSADSERLVV